MTRFSECFLLVFAQLAAGGAIALAVPPSSSVDKGFYRSSAAVFLAAVLVFLVGRGTLGLRPGSTLRPCESGVWLAFAAALAAYLASMWRGSWRLRARTFAASVLLALLALSVSAGGYRLGPVLGPAALLYPLAFVTSALVLGAAGTGMLLGHWYLIDVGLSIRPLVRLSRYFVGVLLLQLLVSAVTLGVLALAPGAGRDAVRQLWDQHRALVALRFTLGPAAALGIGALILRTLAIPQTMAATGLFYIATLAVVVGELLGRLILFRTSLPL